jgi:hypothetical protein
LNIRHHRAGLWSLLLAIVVAGCTASHYRKSADKETYSAISTKAPLVTNMEPNFTLEQTNHLDLTEFPQSSVTNEFLGEAAYTEIGAKVLTVEAALKLATRYSRTFQNNREQLYLNALSLTLKRHQFAPMFSARSTPLYQVANEPVVELDPVTGDQIIVSDKLAETHAFRAENTQIGVDWLIRDVGRISAAFTTDFFRFLSGSPNTLISSQIGATFTRPLLRNSGYKQELEILTQGERDLLYQIRDFVKFRKNFSVQIAAAYYGVLGNRDAVRNAYLNLQSSKKSGERTRALAKEGRTTQTDLGRIEQQELSAEATWVTAVRTYKRALDDFKFQLGVPVETRIVLDDKELAQLAIRHPKMMVDEAIQVALAARLDYQNAKDQVADADRSLALAIDRFKPQLDFVATGGFNSPAKTHGFPLPELDRYNWSVGSTIDLPLERKAERNIYRSAIIDKARAVRTVSQDRDQIELQVRDSWRTLEQARRNYEISEIGVNLAQRRVEEQELLAELGRAKALDQVDAQNALVSSKDQRTTALVAHTIARLQFWDNMGILYIKDDGLWADFE